MFSDLYVNTSFEERIVDFVGEQRQIETAPKQIENVVNGANEPHCCRFYMSICSIHSIEHEIFILIKFGFGPLFLRILFGRIIFSALTIYNGNIFVAVQFV